MKKPFEWDLYSDQPALLKDKEYKKQMRKKEFLSICKTFIKATFMIPASLIMMPFVKRREIKSSEFFSLGVDFQREPIKTLELIKELEVETLLLRFKLWDMQSLDELKSFLQNIKDKKIILKIMQDREHIEDLTLLEKDIKIIFKALHKYIDIFEIGTTINRSKWGFFSVDEYNRFFETIYKIKKSEFPDMQLIGSGVIDFEYYYTTDTLFNLCNYHYDGVSSLLYVDRRGAPENTQLGFSLSDKLALLSTMVWLSPKTKQKLHITEVNWPISKTAPYAPTSEYECVDEKTYSDFMIRYYLLGFASQQVDSISWHQLLAKGYGLVDNIDGMRKRDAFYSYKFMIKNLRNAQFLRLDIKRGYYILQCWIDEKLLQIHWSLVDTTLKNEEFFEVYSAQGKKIKDDELQIGSSPIYIYITKEVGEKVNCI